MSPDRLDGLTSWHSEAWRGLRVVILGLGATGFAAADTLAELGARCLVIAAEPDAERAAILEILGVPVVLADAGERALHELTPELAILASGASPDAGLAGIEAALVRRGVPAWDELELAWRVRDKITAADWICVTGAAGAAGTAGLAAALLRADGRRVADVGGPEAPVLDAIRAPDGLDVLVVGIAPARAARLPLDGPGALHPLASLCLAVDPADPAAGAAMGRVYANTRVACCYHRADPATMRLVEEAEVEEGCRAIGVGLGVPGPSDLGVIEGILVDRAFLDDRRRAALELTTLEELEAVGIVAPAQVLEVLAAAALARAADVPTGVIHDALGLAQAG